MTPLLADVFQFTQWSNFFLMLGGGVAALTGLVFVALSIALSVNLQTMTEDATHKWRSINTLAGLTSLFVSCGLVLVPNQGHVEVGVDILGPSLIAGSIFLFGFRRAFDSGSTPSKGRLYLGSALYLVESVGAVVLMSGRVAGLYIAAVTMVLIVAFMISASWLLVVSVYRAKVT